jgi:potassium voltage-gated channel Eag-related subfamily H protein 8
MQAQTDARKAIIVVYYAFTSLSTVGFGDFYPKSDFERVLCAIILLFGVAIFSYIMGNFINILDQYNNLNSDLDEGDELARFFGLIRRFNENVPLKITLKEQIERHFDYKWINDKNQAIDDESEREMLEQLPVEVINKIYGDFLFSDFCKIFQRFFRIPKDYDVAFKNPGYHDYYDWSDQEYRFFMLQLLQYLEPRQEDAGTILF